VESVKPLSLQHDGEQPILRLHLLQPSGLSAARIAGLRRARLPWSSSQAAATAAALLPGTRALGCLTCGAAASLYQM